ncbi:pilus assembly protein [Azotobacter chroococcum subsp. isscasi]|uniref:TadE/TadG family type IV pilus assembly protein n=1 Tax=Azotobacter chroococcum TaxID=353 RepID=UPI00103B423B|nr:TadE/TadG family type IV pilus assembly protein [Azotobacter chroococcum]TBW09836.1 pilus assembly protein [Azotobacter chroococcum subsp. isscasi]
MNRRAMQGVYVVEFAIIGLLLFVLLFGVLEMGRLYFTVNTMDEVVRRGARLASVCNISDPVVLHRALFNEAADSGESALVANLKPSNLQLSYFDKNGALVSSPGDLTSATGFRAIRFVRLRVANFKFDFLVPGLQGLITLPVFQSTLPRESLGRHAESGVTPEITPC